MNTLKAALMGQLSGQNMRKHNEILIPVIFVLLWSTGFIGARYAMPHAEPASFLSLRFGLVTMLFGAYALFTGSLKHLSARDVFHLSVTGFLIHGVYLGGVFVAIYHGLEAGTSALIVGIQPVLTAFLAVPLLGERVRGVQWLGLVLGCAGVALVVMNKLEAGLGTPFGVWLSIVALFAIAIGALYQKKYCQKVPILTGAVVQFGAATLAMTLIAHLFESWTITWTHELILSLLWLVVVLSVGATSLLMVLIKQGAATNVASLFFLVPPVTALTAWIVFGETFGLLSILGMAFVVAAVVLVNRA